MPLSLREVLEASSVHTESFPRKHLFRSNSAAVIQERVEGLTEFIHNVLLPNIDHDSVAQFLELQQGGDPSQHNTVPIEGACAEHDNQGEPDEVLNSASTEPVAEGDDIPVSHPQLKTNLPVLESEGTFIFHGEATHWGTQCNECEASPIVGTMYADIESDYSCCSECYDSRCDPAERAVLKELRTFDETLDALFAGFDTDSDGFLSKQEVSQLVDAGELMFGPV